MKEVRLSGIRKFHEMAVQSGMRDIKDLSIGEPDFDTPRHIIDGAKKALDEGFTHYTHNRGLMELRKAIAEKLQRENGIEADPTSDIMVTTGASEGLLTALLSTINPADEVLVPDPYFPLYENVVTMVGGRSVKYVLHEQMEFELDPTEIETLITPKTKMIILNSPNNPTGSVTSRKNLEAVADLALKRDLLVIADEVYEKLVYDGNQHYSIASIPEMKNRTITVNAFSKTYAMTGWRIGYVIAKPEIMEQMVKIHVYSGICANAFVQRAALVALKGPQNCVDEMVAEFKERRDLVIQRLNEMDGVSCRTPKGAFYVFPNVSSINTDSENVARFLVQNAGVITVPGSAFGKHGEGYLRLSYATGRQNLKTAMERMEKAVKEAKNNQR